MSQRNVTTVARWEYHRFAKPRDLAVGTLVFMLMFGIYGFVGHLVRSKGQEEKTVGVIGGALMGLRGEKSLERFRLEHMDGEEQGGPAGKRDAPRGEDRTLAEEALRAKEIDALLVILGSERAQFVVREERGWQKEFISLVVQHRLARRLSESDLDPQVVRSLTAPADIERVLLHPKDGETERADPKTVLVVVMTMLVGLFLGFSYVFVAITSEKTQRVTESVLAAIRPQEWIDGKIIGLTLVVLVNVVCYGGGYLLYKTAALFVWKDPFTLPVGIGDPIAFAHLLLFAMLGFGFWFTLFALVAATINDPNSSSRSSLMLLPFLPLALTVAGLDEPDALWMRLAAMLPGLSPAAMPVRIMRGDPHWLEVLASVTLLAIAIALLRRAAGRVLGVSMLMTGKEPSWGEVWRWAREK